MSKAQDVVAENVRARGYRQKPDGSQWAVEQFAARQVAKIVEETNELNYVIRQNSHEISVWEEDLDYSAEEARASFDKGNWKSAVVIDVKRAKKELADVQVIVLTLASALEELSGKEFDVIESAVEKSGADISRGIRAQT